MKIKINPREVILAKIRTKEFDRQKTYNKFVCKNNYIGYLSEMVLDRWLTEEGIIHEWVPFIKQGTVSPDFIINGVSIDLKCSSGGELWVTPYTPHDIYISSQVTPTCDYLFINGWLGRAMLNRIKYGHSRQIVRGKRTSYIINRSYLLPLDLLGVFSSTLRSKVAE